MWRRTEVDARVRGALEGRTAARELRLNLWTTTGTLTGHRADKTGVDSIGAQSYCGSERPVIYSSLDALLGRRPSPIRKEIIGHGMCRAIRGLRANNRVAGNERAFTLLDQPASEHGGGAFFHPLIEQRANFFAEIGGMAQSRKFVTLQGVSRSRQKKLPWGLGLVTGHGILLPKQEPNIITTVIYSKIYESSTAVDICGKTGGRIPCAGR